MSSRPTLAARRELEAAMPPEKHQQGLHNDYPDSPDPRKIIRRTPWEDLGPIGDPPYELDSEPEMAPETPPTPESP